MTRTIFGLLFIVVTTVVLLLLYHFGYAEIISTFAVVFMLAAYFIGQYSVRLPKERNNN